MVTNGNGNQNALGIDRTTLRLAVFGVLVVAAFVGLFSRLWFLQVLAAGDYRQLAKENRVRRIHSEPARGKIMDRNGVELVANRKSLAVTIDRQIVDGERETKRVLRKLSRLLDRPVKELRTRLEDATVSPYKPVAVANDISEDKVGVIIENQENFPGVDVEKLPVRKYPQGDLLAHVLGYVNEIRSEQLKMPQFKKAKPAYQAGDIVGQAGIELTYDNYLRGRPEIKKVVVNSGGDVVAANKIAEGRTGKDLILSIDATIQKATEKALADGIEAARTSYQAPAGGVVVMDPDNGQVVAMSSLPTYDPSMLADGITQTEFDSLNGDPDTGDDDALLNRTIQQSRQPGSTFKVVTAGAALWSGVADTSTYLDCPPAREYGNIVFKNWTSADLGAMGLAESLEVSCDTFYYELGWRMEDLFGWSNGDESERFQKYIRMAGFGHETGIDLPNETDGVVPDAAWCKRNQRLISEDWCQGYEWLPGYTVNMSIGQGDMTVTPLQMAVTFAAIANGGDIVQPQLGMALSRTRDDGGRDIVREFKPKVVRRLPLSTTDLAVMEQGLVDVISGDSGTAGGAFAGFPTDRYPLAGKTGTAQIGLLESGLNYAWFISYGPVPDPDYVIAVYLEKAGHGGESAAPVARQIWEAIFDIDKSTEVALSQDSSG